MDKASKAVENFKNGYNCAQSVMAAFCEDFGISERDGLLISEGFGGGMGRMRSTCGAVTAMFMLAGLKYSDAKAGDLDTRAVVYAKVQELAEEFKKEAGSIICAELLKGQLPQDKSANPTPRTDTFYKKRPCVECVRLAARLAEKHLLKGD